MNNGRYWWAKSSRNRSVVLARQATQPGGIGYLKSALGLHKSLKIRALVYNRIQTCLRNLKWATKVQEWPTHFSPPKKYTKRKEMMLNVLKFIFLSRKYFILRYMPDQLFVAFMMAVVCWNIGRQFGGGAGG
jgi:hypothetical protein